MSSTRTSLPLEHLDRLARHKFISSYNRKLPLAMVGSGMSMIYGGVGWEESIRLVLQHGVRLIDQIPKVMDAALAPENRLAPPDLLRLSRHRTALSAMLAEDALRDTADKYVALDLCSDAMSFLDSLEATAVSRNRLVRKWFVCPVLARARPADPKIGRFRAYMAELYRDDTLLIRQRLAERFALLEPQGATLKEQLDDLDCGDVQRLARLIYAKDFYDTAKTGSAFATRIVDDIGTWLDYLYRDQWISTTETMPIDRRSTLALVLAHRTPDERRNLFKDVLNTLAPATGTPPDRPGIHRPLLDPLMVLQRWFGIRRFMTLNFDYLLEHALMLDDVRESRPAPAGFEVARREGLLNDYGASGGVERVFADGLAAASDSYREGAAGRLFEFALNSPDYAVQILHLHGRADIPESMLLTDSDYNRQYRRDRYKSTTLEQALDVTLTGNPILFVGIGLSESDITRALRELVSRSDAGPQNPAFAVMTVPNSDSTAWRRQQAQLRQHGIYLITAGVPSGAKQVTPSRYTDLLANRLAAMRADRAKADTGAVPAEVESDANLEKSKKLIEDVKELIAVVAKQDPNAKRKPTDLEVKHAIEKWHKDAKDDLFKRANNIWFTADDRLWIDNSAFIALADEICKYDDKHQVEAWQAQSWIDFIDRIGEKLSTLAVVETLGSMRRELEADFANPLIRGDYKGSGEPIAVPEDKFPRLKIRDQQFVVIPDNNAGHLSRHNSIDSTSRAAAHANAQALETEAKAILNNPSAFLFCYADLGGGKGSLAKRLKTAFPQTTDSFGIFINFTFGVEIDSVSRHLLRLFSFCTQQATEDLRETIRQIKLQIVALADRSKASGADTLPTNLLRPIVLWGLERLVDRKGQPIAAELELLIDVLMRRELEDAGFRLILIATPEVEPFLKKIAERNRIALEPHKIEENLKAFGLLAFMRQKALVRSAASNNPSLARAINVAAKRSEAPILPNGARSEGGSMLIELVLQRWNDLFNFKTRSAETRRKFAELDRNIIGILAFVGTPIEAEALLSIDPLPDCLAALGFHDHDQRRKPVIKSLARLLSFGLVLQLPPFDPVGKRHRRRFVLHRQVMAVVRDHYGVRSGEEPLSNSFSLTLAASMPTDLVVPDIDIQDRMQQALGRLRGGWKDDWLSDDKVAALAEIRAAVVGNEISFKSEEVYRLQLFEELERAVRQLEAPMPVLQRASAGIVRSFFASASLVAHIPEGPIPTTGVFELHRRNIAELIEQVRTTQNAQATAVGRMESIKAVCSTIDSTALSVIGDCIANPGSVCPPPLYGTEILWLLNEQAVIALLQGCLNDARRLFSQAEAANGCFRSNLKGTVNWRRLRINRTFAEIECGHIAMANSQLAEIGQWVLQRNPELFEEDRLTKPLILGYQGLCAHLGGRYGDATRLLEQSILWAERSGQERAEAISRIRLASLQYGRRQLDEGDANLSAARSIAEAGRQMDIVWRARLTECANLSSRTHQKKIESILAESIQYSRHMGIPRIEVQALREEAEHRIALEDLEGASQSAALAMALATRHGMVLQRIALRVVMGRILLRRKEPSGQHLLKRATMLADRIGYQLMVERAQEAQQSIQQI